jgi:hypothetical protein
MTKFEKQSLVWFVIYVVVLGALILLTSSCTSRQITHTPTHREIKCAMKYSTSNYQSAPVRTTGVSSQSRFVFEYNK